MNRVARIGLGLGMMAATAVSAEACVGDPPATSSTPTQQQDAGGGDTDAGGPSLCDQYCQAVTGNCKEANSQYASFAECQEMCALLPAGVEGVKENGIQCRLAQAKAAGTKDSCLAAGPFGGAVCGTRCQAFCSLVAANCGSQTAPPYPSESTCQEECATLTFDPAQPEGPTGPLGGDTLNCRGQHLRLSLHDKGTHCPHTAVNSAVCKPEAVDAGN
jgi:hypothetical protein